jgi:CobQ/CobB/MinD/ParA nucleotide binding domain
MNQAKLQFPETQPEKRILFSIGGKGGVGKTAVMVALAEWLDANGIPISLLDCDMENKSKGTLQQYFPHRCRKIDIRQPTGLDAFIEEAIDGDKPVVVADLGAGSGQDAHQWFDGIFDQLSGLSLGFVAVGAVTANPASVESVFSWAEKLKKRVSYLIVRNLKDGEKIRAFDKSEEAETFRQVFAPRIITFEARLPELQTSLENHGVTITTVLNSSESIGRLTKTAARPRLRGYQNRFFAELESVRSLLIPEQAVIAETAIA